jgi:hypothetical protein
MPKEPFAFPVPDEDPFVFLAELSPAQREKFCEAFTAELQEAEAEADRDGWFTIQEVIAEAGEIIAAAKRRRNQ